MPTPQPAAGKELLAPGNHGLLLIDIEPMMTFCVNSIDPAALRTNVGMVASAAKLFEVPHVLTTITAHAFAGPMLEEITGQFPGEEVIDRTNTNAWEDPRIVERVQAMNKDKLVIAGLWTSVCALCPALSAVEQGYEVYVIADACGDVTAAAHDMAMQRMIQAGVRPMTSVQYLLELQRDWARRETYDGVCQAAIRWGGAFGLGITYARDMVPELANEAKQAAE